MAPINARRPGEDEDMIDDVEEAADDQEEKVASAPAVSDRRRRRQMKRGEYVAPTADEDEEDEEEAQVVRKDRPTPSQREGAVKPRNPIARFFGGAQTYLKDTRSELSKVAWLSREDMIRLSQIVIIVTAVSAAFLGLVSFLFGYLVQLAATADTTIIGGVAIVAIIIVVGGGWLLRDRLFGNRFD